MNRTINKLFFITVLCLHLITSCNFSTLVKFPSTFKFITSLPPEEKYQIYDAIIESSYAGKPIVIILNQTYHYKPDASLIEYWQETYPVLTELLGSYLKSGNQLHQLENHFAPNDTEVLLVDVEYVDWIFEAEDFDQAWETFHKTHSESYGYLRFSHVMSNSEQNLALVFVARNCGPTCGIGEFYLLSKENEEWEIVETITVYFA